MNSTILMSITIYIKLFLLHFLDILLLPMSNYLYKLLEFGFYYHRPYINMPILGLTYSFKQ